MQTSKDRKEDIFQKFTLISQINSNSFEDGRTNLQCNLLLSDLRSQQMGYDLGYLGDALSDIVRKFADKGRNEYTKGWNEIFHIFGPIVDVLEDGLAQKLVIWFQLGCICNKSWVELESVASKICKILLDYQIEGRSQVILNTGKSILILLAIG